jgi:hypothetical protein
VEQGYSYELKQEGQVVAYVRVTKAGVLLTPKKLSSAALNELQQSLELGELPHGVDAKEVKQSAPVLQREKPNWKELTPSTWKRNRWLKARQH